MQNLYCTGEFFEMLATSSLQNRTIEGWIVFELITRTQGFGLLLEGKRHYFFYSGIQVQAVEVNIRYR
jgi:hypothetical protein